MTKVNPKGKQCFFSNRLKILLQLKLHLSNQSYIYQIEITSIKTKVTSIKSTSKEVQYNTEVLHTTKKQLYNALFNKSKYQCQTFLTAPLPVDLQCPVGICHFCSVEFCRVWIFIYSFGILRRTTLPQYLKRYQNRTRTH